MNKPRFLHDPKIWPADIYLGAFQKFDIYFEEIPAYQEDDALLICRFGSNGGEYYTGISGLVRARNYARTSTTEMHIALEAAMKMYDDYRSDPSVSPNARA